MTEPPGAHHEPGPEPAPSDVAAGHEVSDVSIRGLIIFLVGLLASLAAVVFAISWMFSFLSMRAQRSDSPPPPLAPLRTKGPPEPRLQETPALEMRKMREAEEAALTNTRWIDKQQGIVQIPIDRAMELIGQRGLPHWPAAKEADQNAAGDDRKRKQPDNRSGEAQSTREENEP
jgi:hypothetical protein